MATRILAPTDADIDTYRSVRLEALAADPQAFCSSFEREAAFDDATWRQRVGSMDGRPGATIVDEVDDAVGGGVAAVVGVGLTETPGVAVIVGMWVRPGARGGGVAGRLVEAALAWAVDAGATTVVLGVIATNAPAIRLYERCGFSMTGRSNPAPGRPDDVELEMARPVTP